MMVDILDIFNTVSYYKRVNTLLNSIVAMSRSLFYNVKQKRIYLIIHEIC